MRPRLLITDDERDLLDTLYYNFKKENYDVYTASSGKEAIEILDKQPIDLAILDIMLPDMSGLDICKHIKINRNQSHTAVIMLTAKGEEIDRILGFELGADDYVVKPFSMRELTLRVSSLIKRNEDKNKDNKMIAFVTQTTLSVDDTKEIIKILKNRFENIREPQKEDICYATTNRQMAVKNIAKNCDMFFIIGSRNSSNSVRLVEVAKKSGCENSILIHSESEIPYDKIENANTIGISSGASAPEILVDNFINDLKKRFTIKIDEVEIIKENVVFKIPKKLN